MSRICIIAPNKTAWKGPARVATYRQTLLNAGHTVEVSFGDRLPPNLNTFDVVLNHALCARADRIRAFAERNPLIQVVAINHSALPYLFAESAFPAWTSAIWSARNLDNFWLASQNETGVGDALGLKRIIRLPSPVPLVDPRLYRVPGAVLNVAIAGRTEMVKNFISSITACAILRERVRLHVCVKPDKHLNYLFKAYQLRATLYSVMDHGRWIQFLKTVPDIMLQPSLSESYNCVCTEAMQAGVPTIGSECVAACDPKLTLRDPNDVRQMVAAIEAVADDHKRFAERATIFGRRSAVDQAEAYVVGIEHVIRSAAARHSTVN